MPFTLDPWDYPINRLLQNIQMTFAVWVAHIQPTKDKEEQRAIENLLVDLLGLDNPLIKGYYFHWENGRMRRLHIIPNPTVRRVPGIKKIKKYIEDMCGFTDGVVWRSRKRSRKKKLG